MNPRDWHIDSIAWGEAAPDGTQYALLEGRRDTPGEPFTYAFRMPADFWDPPHRHTADARVFVLRGTLRLAYGTDNNRSRARAYPAGSVVFVPANAVHFDGAEEETVILGVAVAPWSTHYADPAHTGSAGTQA